MAESRLATGNLGAPDRFSFIPLRVAPVYCGFLYLLPPRWVLAIMSAPAEFHPEPHGTLRKGKMAELRLSTGDLGNPGLVLRCPIVVTPIYGGFVYLAFPYWLLVGNVRRPLNVSRNPTEPRGTPRNAKIWELRLETGDLSMIGLAFCFPFGATPIYGGFAYLVCPHWVLGVVL